MIRYNDLGEFELLDVDALGLVFGGLETALADLPYPDARTISANTVCTGNGACNVNFPCSFYNNSCGVNTRCGNYFCL